MLLNLNDEKKNIDFLFFIIYLFFLCIVIEAINHPFHLHGHKFIVKKMGQALPGNAPLTTNSSRNSPCKDSISVPSKGYVVLRFRANNPGMLVIYYKQRKRETNRQGESILETFAKFIRLQYLYI